MQNDACRMVNGPSKDTGRGPIAAGLSQMTLRERWRRAMHSQPVDRLPNLEFGYWDETLPLWHEQGLPDGINDEKAAYAYFGIEDWVQAPVQVRLCPVFEKEVIEQNDDYVVWRDPDGALRREITGGIKTIPQYLRFAIETRADWEVLRARLDPKTPERYPQNWNALVEEYRGRDYPLCIDIGSMLGKPRNLIGFEKIALMVYDDRALLEEIIETCCVCVCETIKRALADVEFDFAAGWEDICFKNGPIVSPRTFRELVVPRYKRITDLLHEHGIDVIWTDCDGDINPLMDEFLDGGINCMFPLEVAAGTDPVALREKYGRRVLLHGGVDKMALLKGPKAIEQELLRLKPVVDEGGFIPHVDHRCPADVTLENYKTYLRLKRDIFNAGDLVAHYDQ